MMSQFRGFRLLYVVPVKIAASELSFGTSQNPFACWREERVKFPPNQPTDGNLRPILGGFDELRELGVADSE
jgi:hypothetical protein